MRPWLLAVGFSSLLALRAFAADPLVLNVPPEMSACLPVTFTWSGGTSPYSLSYRIGSGAVGDETNIGAPILIGQTEGPQFTFEAPDYPSTSKVSVLSLEGMLTHVSLIRGGRQIHTYRSGKHRTRCLWAHSLSSVLVLTYF